MLYLLFFCSGLSGLIYQVVWVRVFGNVFGNTIHSTSLVIAVFMLGLGVGSYVVGAWADRRYVEPGLDGGAAARTGSLLRAYGYFELVIGLLGFGVSALLPHLGQLSALVSSYSRDANGWYVLSTASYLARGLIAVILLTPITLLMGGTLTLLIRSLVGRDFQIGSWRIAVLYAVNTAGAALGCFLTDFALVPGWGLRGTQMVAVSFNLIAGFGAFWLGSRKTLARAASSVKPKRVPTTNPLSITDSEQASSAVIMAALAVALTGFAAMGMEVVWFRHFSILLGEFRAVFSLLLTVILIGIGAGSLVGGLLHRSTARPAHWLILVQGLFVGSALLGLATADAEHLKAAVMADPAYQAVVGRAVEAVPRLASGWARTFEELWFNARPILVEVGITALLMGLAFPLANAVIQRAERSVGRRAGVLYLANTVGAVCGSLAAGFLLLPLLGIQASATILTLAAALAVVPLCLATGVGRTLSGPPSRNAGSNKTRPTYAVTLAGSMLISGVALGWWLLLPSDYVITRALVLPTGQDRLLTLSEGLTEVIAVREGPDRRRMLVTNGHPMSSTAPPSQRYMRALAHIPLLSIDRPETVLVMCFGVGNTAHAATLHPSVRRVEVVDLSRHVLVHAGYFSDVNKDVLTDPRVVVYVNDGRQHLQMQREASYDLITLEPPPITQAGMGALYSREFYALARSRLKPKGYISQWLPVSQVPKGTTLAMIRAFVEVFPQAVLISGAQTNLLLVGANDSRIQIDPSRVAAALLKAPAVQADLQRLDLGSVREVVGTFVGSAQTLAEATRDSPPVSDDRPILEYGVRSLLNHGEEPPAAMVDLSQVAAWCPGCFVDGKPVPLVDGLDTYLALLDLSYRASPIDIGRTRAVAEGRTRMIAGSAYLGAVVPESADLHNVLGTAFAAKGRSQEAITEFREALRLDPDSATAHWNLGVRLASPQEALDHLRRSVQLNPGNGQARYDLATSLLESRQYEEAADEFREALRLMPNSVKAHNNLGVTLASQGKLDEAIDQFQQALILQPEFADARRNLTAAQEQRHALQIRALRR